jgi:hypothetical protein
LTRRKLHTYEQRDLPGTDMVYFAILDVGSSLFERPNGDQWAHPIQVDSTNPVHFNEAHKARREAFNICCQLNGGKPRKARFREAIQLLAQLKELSVEKRYVSPTGATGTW